jgi:hypothetical protein
MHVGQAASSRWPWAKGWTRRYFVLSGGVLVHLKSKDAKVPRGMVSLDGATVRVHACPGLHTGFCVMLVARTRSAFWRGREGEELTWCWRAALALFPESRRDAIEWQVALEHNVGALEAGGKSEVRLAKSLSRRKLAVLDLPADVMLGVDVRTATTDTVNERAALSAGGDAEEAHDVLRIGAFYEVLGVPPNCTFEQARKAYYALAKSFHPDKNPEADRAKFALINRAFEVVKVCCCCSGASQGHKQGPAH